MSLSSTVLHPIVIAQVMLNFAARHGVDRDTCLLGTDISAEHLGAQDAFITREQEMRLIENLILALPHRPALGFELGLQYNISTFGIFGFALRISRNLREAAHRALRYLPLSTAYCRFQIVEQRREFGLAVDPGTIPRHLRQFLLERDIATGINLLKELGLAGIDIQSLEFVGPAPEHAVDIERLCGLKPWYGRPRNAVVLRREDADRPLPMYDANLVRMLEDQCRVQLELRQTTGITGQVRKHLLGEAGLVASLDEVAAQLALSPRSLRRKLEEEGSSFRGLVEQERKMLAGQLLQTTQMKLDEMALQLGYADTASFTRAFRRWFKQSPGEYRQQHQP